MFRDYVAAAAALARFVWTACLVARNSIYAERFTLRTPDVEMACEWDVNSQIKSQVSETLKIHRYNPDHLASS
jgi:hypothetical protein